MRAPLPTPEMEVVLDACDRGEITTEAALDEVERLLDVYLANHGAGYPLPHAQVT